MYFYLQKENNWLGVKYSCPPSLSARQQSWDRTLPVSCCMEEVEVEAVLEDRWRSQLELKVSTELWPALREVARPGPGPSCPP